MGPLTNSQRTLVEEHLKLVKAIARARHGYLPAFVERDDVEQAGCMGLIDAARRYDGREGNSFETFARYRINGAISDYLRRLDPVSKEERAAINAGEAEEVGHLAIDDGLPLASPSETPEEAAMALQFTAQIRTLVNGLSGRERTVVEQYYYADRRLADVGKDFGCREARTSQIHKAAVEKLRAETAFVERILAFRWAMTSGVMRRMSSFTCLIAACVFLASSVNAQTRVTTSSLAGTPGTTPRVWVVLSDGKLAEADLENIALIFNDDGKPVLRAQQQTVIKSRHILTAARADYALTGTLDTVHRNGLLQTEGEDYQIIMVAGVNTLRFNANAVPQARDIVQIRELK